MYTISQKYESANRHKGTMPVHFIKANPGSIEDMLEGVSKVDAVVEVSSQWLQEQQKPLPQAQVHYVMLGGELYRVFIGRGATSLLEYGNIKSVVRMGETEPGIFDGLELEPGLSESQINRAIRSIRRNNNRNEFN